MKIVVTGTRGQVARSLVEATEKQPSIELICVGRPTLDLRDPASVVAAVTTCEPDVVVSAAAFTAVDLAEEQPEIAHQVNAVGAGAVADAAAKAGAPVIHLSTDYVFSGEGTKAWREDDPAEPQSVYGRTKLAGEHAVREANPQHVIVRTAWVYSPFGNNFVKTMLRLATERDDVAVVADQWGNPTAASDVAEAILRVATAVHTTPFSDFGIYHVAGTGDTNWSGFAKHIFAASETAGGPFATVREVTTDEYPTAARRPANSRLSTNRFRLTFKWQPPPWQTSSEQVVRRLTPP